MATGGQLSRSVVGASEEYFEFTCSPCEQDLQFLEAEAFCEECSEFLCCQCLAFHNKFEKMKSHRIVDKDGMKAQDQRKPLSGRQLSLYVAGASEEYFEFTCSPCEHASKVLEAEVYCQDCSEYLCFQCLECHNKFEKMKNHRMVDKEGMKAQDHRKPLSGRQLSLYVAGASDEYFEFRCSPCEHDSKVLEAEVYCEECSEYLCRQCLNFHNKFEKMKAHRMVAKDDMKAQDLQKPLPVPTERKERIKCVFVGDGAVGATYLIHSYMHNKFLDTYIPTIFDDFEVTVTTGGETYTLGVFDTAGQEDWDRVRPLSYPQTDVCIVCFSIICPDTFENVSAKWVPEITHYCPGVPFLLVGCKADLRDDAATKLELAKKGQKLVTGTEATQLARELGAVKYVECSAKTQKGVKKVFDEIVLAAPNPQVVLAASNPHVGRLSHFINRFKKKK